MHWGANMYCDCHAHLEELGEEKLAGLRKGNVEVIANSVDMRSYEFAVAAKKRISNIRKVFFGLHPDRADAKAAREMLGYAAKHKVDGIGEIGLDAKYGKMKIQKEVFEKFLGFAEEKNLPAAVHSRNSVRDVLGILHNYKPRSAMLHWFSGDEKQLAEALKRGYFIGITPSHPKAARWVVEKCPLERILLETDSPVLGRQPKDVVKLAEEVARIKGSSLQEFLRQHEKNAREFCKAGRV